MSHNKERAMQRLFIFTIITTFAIVAYFVYDMFTNNREYLSIYLKPIPLISTQDNDSENR